MPAPPLPMLASQEVPDEISFVSGEVHVANTHDLMALLLLTATQRDNKEERCARAKKQKVVVGSFLARMAAIDENTLTMDALQQAVYDSFCAFTRDSIE
eukprot:131793-Rhodomonas_salina.1